jgi:hypothetical protein
VLGGSLFLIQKLQNSKKNRLIIDNQATFFNVSFSQNGAFKISDKFTKRIGKGVKSSRTFIAYLDHLDASK